MATCSSNFGLIYQYELIMRIFTISVLIPIAILIFNTKSYAQCDPSVPYYQVDLSSNPDTTWVLLEGDALDRTGLCCSASSNENCIQFEITLHPGAAGIYFDYDGAGAFGSLAWQMDCGTSYSLKDTICVTDPGPFVITFCKPGSDGGNYFIQSVASPTFPEDQAIPLGCNRPLEVLGVTAASITWSSVYPGNPGDYNYLLSCTNCLEPILTPDASLQPYVEFAMEGYPLLDACSGAFTFYDTVRFTFQDSIKIAIDNSNATFCSGGSASVNASATGGDGNYTFHWYNSSLVEVFQGASFTTNSAGTYTVEVRDGNYAVGSCEGVSVSFSVSESFPPVVDAGVDQVLCATTPESNLVGIVTFASGGIWSGGTGVYTPSNTDLSTLYTPTNAEIANGSVTLTLTSTGAGGGCVNNSDDVVLFFADTVKTDLIDFSLGCDNSTTILNPIISGGITPYIYAWSDGTTTISNAVGTGTHCLTVTDAIGCTTTDCSTISAPSQLTITTSSTNVTSDGLSDGTATATPTGGTSPYSYSWSSGGTNALETGLSYGIYTVTVTDDNGCSLDGSVVVNEPRCLGFEATTTSVNVLCNDDSTGSATVSLTGGTLPFTYAWNDYLTQSAATASNLPSGVYTVIVTDDNSCETFATATVLESAALINTMSHTDASTLGGSDGDASTSVVGGTSPYSYLWDNAETTSAISGLLSATYTVVVTDVNGCTLTDSVFVSEPPCNDFAAITSATDALCFGNNDGTAQLTVINGVGPYSINWSSGQNDTTFVDNLSAGLYTVEVVDSRNCYTFASFGVNDPSLLSVGLSVTNVSCNNELDGTIDLTVSGGTFPIYIYDWSNGKTTEDIINLGSGTYTVNITDMNGCVTTSSATITEPSAITYSYSTTDVTCYGGADGAIDFTVNGGTSPYVYSWSNGASTQDLNGIDVGGYLLELNDGNFCSPSTAISVEIFEPSPVVIDTVIISCPAQGATTTLVNISVSGGTSAYQVSYDDGINYNPLGNYSENLAVADAYNIMAMDINGCLALQNYPITIDTNVYSDNYTVNYCYTSGQLNETVYVTPDGGDGGAYEISFNNGISYNAAGDYDIDVPINSSYNLLIRDGKGCISETYPFELPNILNGSTVIISNYNGEDISCNGAADGHAFVNVNGGGSPYTYLWSDGQTLANATGLSAGNYSVTVTDTNGCSVLKSVTVSEPVILSITTSITSNYNGEDVSCNGSTDGSAMVVESGGVAPYTYLWDSGQTTSAISGIGAGNYLVTVTDVNGCTSQNSISLTEPLTVQSSVSIISNYNGEDISCFGASDGSALVNGTGGETPYSYLWSDGQTTQSANGLPNGTISVTITDANGCTSQSSLTLTEPLELVASVLVTSDYNGEEISCNGAADGQASSTQTGGTGTYSYSWSDGQTTPIATGLTSGSYTVTITDDNGCMSLAFVSLAEPTAISATISVTSDYNGQNISCFGYTDGQATVVPSGGTQPYIYGWTNGQNTDVANNLASGIHTASVTDVNGCFVTVDVTLTEPVQLSSSAAIISSYNGEDISCYNGSNGVAMVSPVGGTLPYTYSWSDGQTANVASGLSEGLYTVDVTDVNGCIVNAFITLTQPTEINITATIVDVSCNGGNDGAIDVTPTGGITPYSYLWSNGAITEDATNLTASIYTVILTDDNGCIDTLNNLVVDPTALDLNIEITNTLCKNDSNGSIDLTVVGGTLPYSYLWTNTDTTEDIVNQMAGSYSVTVTDGNGCFTDISGIVTEPDSLLFTYVVSDVICYGESNGSIDVSVTGGTVPYTYSWSNGENSEDITGLESGYYELVVLDSNNCLINDSIYIDQPDSLWATISSPEFFHGYNVSLFGESDGEIELEPTGGTAPYTYDWSSGESAEDITDLVSGEYYVLITDEHNCEYYAYINLTQPLDLAMPTGFSPNSDGRNDLFEIRGIDAYPDNEVTIFNRWGNIVYNTTGYNNTWSGVSNQGNDLPDGTYFVVVTINSEEITLNNYVDLRRK